MRYLTGGTRLQSKLSRDFCQTERYLEVIKLYYKRKVSYLQMKNNPLVLGSFDMQHIVVSQD